MHAMNISKLKKLIKNLIYYCKAVISYNSFLKNRFDKKYVVCFTHNHGGGATKYLDEICEFGDFSNEDTIIIKNYIPKKVYEIRINENGFWKRYFILDFDKLKAFIESITIQELFVNELFNYPDLTEILNWLPDLKKSANCSMTYCVHDFYCICPGSLLLDRENIYCKITKKCEECLGSTESWRKMWHTFLRECSEIRAYSENTKWHIQQVFKDIDINVIPHKVYSNLRTVNIHKSTKADTFNIAVLGVLSLPKGSAIIEQLIDIIENENEDIRIIHFGDIFTKPIVNSNVYYEEGHYDLENLPNLMEKYNIQAVLVASICPETFSYTCAESIKMDIPLITFDIGAQGDKAKNYDRGYVVEKVSAEALFKGIINLRKQIVSE